MKYLIMKVKRSYAIALSEDNAFYVIANRNYQVGQSIDDPIIMHEYIEKPHPSFFAMYKQGLGIGLGFVTAFVLVLGYMNYQNVPVGSYAINAQSQVEIIVSRSGNVNEVIAKNQEGEKLIADYDYHNKSKEVVTSELLSRAKDYGYVDNKVNIVIDKESTDYDELSNDFNSFILEFDDDEIELELDYDDDEFEIDENDVDDDKNETDQEEDEQEDEEDSEENEDDD